MRDEGQRDAEEPMGLPRFAPCVPLAAPHPAPLHRWGSRKFSQCLCRLCRDPFVLSDSPRQSGATVAFLGRASCLGVCTPVNNGDAARLQTKDKA